MSGVGRLQRVPLREVWAHEAYDFTQWLQQNVDVLNEVLDLTLVAVERERKTESAFSVDLVAEDENGGTVIIENQLGKSDHDHLGKLITYLTAMSARAAIWIVSEPRPEHVAALTWLNEANAARFYLLKMEAVRIGASPPAPLLTVIVRPSEEVAAVGDVRKDFDNRHRIRNRWWSQIISRPEARLHGHIRPSNYSWIGTTSGVRGLGLNYTVHRTSCGAELYIDRGKGLGQLNRRIFDELRARQPEVEQDFGEVLKWEGLDARRACRISYAIEGGYSSPETAWNAIQARQVDAMNRLHTALKPHIEALDLAALERAEESVDHEDEP